MGAVAGVGVGAELGADTVVQVFVMIAEVGPTMTVAGLEFGVVVGGEDIGAGAVAGVGVGAESGANTVVQMFVTIAGVGATMTVMGLEFGIAVGGLVLPLVLRDSGETGLSSPVVLNSEDAATAEVLALTFSEPLMSASPGREQKCVKDLSTTDRESTSLLFR